MSAAEPEVRLVGQLGFTAAHVGVTVASTTGPVVCRWRHDLRDTPDGAVPDDSLVLVRSNANSWRHRGARRERSVLGAGGFGLVPRGSYGAWEFDRERPHESMHLYFPPGYLATLAAADARKGMVELHDRLCCDDPALAHLAALLDATLDAQDQSRLYFEGLVQAIAARVLDRFAEVGPARPSRGGLAPWQLNRACEAMMGSLEGEIGLEELATLAGCSPTHFSRAFKQSTGLAPFHWLAARRIDRAKALLEDNRLPLAEIALAVGFSAQPQFTTAFGRATGVTPARWRRERLG